MEFMIHVFHGFLGSPDDFSFLAKIPNVVLHDTYEESLENISLNMDDVLIGYSMGGRIAMELADRHKFNIKKLVVINSHPGIPDEDKNERGIWEESVLTRFRTLSANDFLKYWNSLPLFEADQPLEGISLDKYLKSAKIFETYRLSRQKYLLPKLTLNRDKVFWIAGERDQKYSDIARNLIVPAGIACEFMPGGHRLYQSPEKLFEVLKRNALI
jgi:2-succinyl-6-hydroxy-2,4-cyclohexadiene-1-carboxylate synthase